MRAAFKEWAVVVDALGRGEQILILRKGGIGEGRDGFRPEHRRFLLFPTFFHQQRELVVPSAQAGLDQITADFPVGGRTRIGFFCEVAAERLVESPAMVERWRGQHVWRDEVIARRFDWGREAGIYALAVRVFRLKTAAELPMMKSYGGCKSWIRLESDVETSGACPVLPEDAFAERLSAFSDAFDLAAAP